mgnify:FL=1
MAPADEPEPGGWHLDKRVPIALIIAIAGQAAAGGWYAATQSARLDQHDRRLTVLEAREDEDRKNFVIIVRDLGEIKAQVKILLDSLK